MSRFDPHAYLNHFLNLEANLPQLTPADFHLNRINDLLDCLDRPQLELRIVHVAGTKGKGSTCALLAYALQESGFKVGLFTSPHLNRVNERMRILDLNNLGSQDPFCGSIADDEMADLLVQMKPAIDEVISKHGFITYFEVLTALGVVHAASNGVDIYVVETGLGGRLDATNALDSHIAVITPISLDHMHLLGNTIEAIAAEKAGIIKDQYQEVVVAKQDERALRVIIDRCNEVNCTYFKATDDLPGEVSISLVGQHQRDNAATVLAIIDRLRLQGFKISDDDVYRGLSNAKWPGRFEVIAKQPTIIVDGAHNDASAKALAFTIKEHYPKSKVVFVLGVSSDKDVKGIISALVDVGDYCIFTKANHPRSFDFKADEIVSLGWTKDFMIEPDLRKALAMAKQQADQSGIIVVTGSLFLVAQVAGIVRK